MRRSRGRHVQRASLLLCTLEQFVCSCRSVRSFVLIFVYGLEKIRTTYGEQLVDYIFMGVPANISLYNKIISSCNRQPTVLPPRQRRRRHRAAAAPSLVVYVNQLQVSLQQCSESKLFTFMHCKALILSV